jgi:TonB family protein
MNQTSVGYFSLLGSVALHGFAVTQSAGELPKRSPPPRPPAFVELISPAPLPEPPALEPPPPEREPAPQRPSERPRPVPPVEEPAPEPASPVAEAPAPELTGVTLTAAEGASFAAPAGNGAARDGAISTRTPGRPHPLGPALRSAPPAPPRTLPLSELSRPPSPPSLSDALERNYPRAARRLGESGDAKVRARVEASGEIRVAVIVSATSPDFGEACRRALIGSRWSAPLDESGRPAATQIYYRCKFRVD